MKLQQFTLYVNCCETKGLRIAYHIKTGVESKLKEYVWQEVFGLTRYATAQSTS